jgi:predicted amidohydrolase
MIERLRLGGAQIPCTTNLAKNIETIKAAIDWAADNEVDYIITPEAALTGYITNFDTINGRTFEDVRAAEQELIEYVKEKQTGLILGTMWIDDDGTRRNQQRYYNLAGTLIGTVCKTYPVDFEAVVAPTELQFVMLHIPHTTTLVKTLGMICNDLWGRGYNYDCIANRARLAGAELIIHSTNAMRGANSLEDDVLNDWSNANLRFMSWATVKAIVTVDNSIKHDGTDWNGYTASESGVVMQGTWRTEVPRKGTQYFHHDFYFNVGQLMLESIN